MGRSVGGLQNGDAVAPKKTKQVESESKPERGS